ncbi:F-box/kelch-repeat protein At3g23880-like [Lotus japonicus]|uniref:F-box/kelch-repeat protein At3g23880-like n=1 Tax=Lotus japonicus TaxID=34305 RepID=UPI00258373C0|nr:F-box/kelch-repeat protein At3g23880-like [Lotus japonicus]
MVLSAPMNIPPPPESLYQQLLPDELIAEVLSWLPVKTLIRLRCVSKIWKALITSDARFIKLHRQRSAAQNPQFLFKWDDIYSHNRNLTSFPVSRLVENPLTTLPDEPHHRITDHGIMSNWLVGSCNGLICIHFHSFNIGFQEDWLYFWNPATRFLSKKLGYFRANYQFSKFTFGYDNSNGTYKVLFFELENGKRKIGNESQGAPVKAFTLGDNLWRNIQSLPVDVVTLDDGFQKPSNGVNLSGTLNWIALHNSPIIFYAPMVSKALQETIRVSTARKLRVDALLLKLQEEERQDGEHRAAAPNVSNEEEEGSEECSAGKDSSSED